MTAAMEPLPDPPSKSKTIAERVMLNKIEELTMQIGKLNDEKERLKEENNRLSGDILIAHKQIKQLTIQLNGALEKHLEADGIAIEMQKQRDEVLRKLKMMSE